MKRLIILFFFILSCNNKVNLDYINGYWEVVSVSKNNKFFKEYPFSNAVDFFVIDSLNNGFRKKIKPMLLRVDGIYFNSAHDYNEQNRPINHAYENADVVVFQSAFNKPAPINPKIIGLNLDKPSGKKGVKFIPI